MKQSSQPAISCRGKRIRRRSHHENAPRSVLNADERKPSSDSESFGRSTSRRQQEGESVDEETGTQSKRPGGTGDVL